MLTSAVAPPENVSQVAAASSSQAEQTAPADPKVQPRSVTQARSPLNQETLSPSSSSLPGTSPATSAATAASIASAVPMKNNPAPHQPVNVSASTSSTQDPTTTAASPSHNSGGNSSDAQQHKDSPNAAAAAAASLPAALSPAFTIAAPSAQVNVPQPIFLAGRRTEVQSSNRRRRPRQCSPFQSSGNPRCSSDCRSQPTAMGADGEQGGSGGDAHWIKHRGIWQR
jgi:hypothetical protein